MPYDEYGSYYYEYEWIEKICNYHEGKEAQEKDVEIAVKFKKFFRNGEQKNAEVIKVNCPYLKLKTRSNVATECKNYIKPYYAWNYVGCCEYDIDLKKARKNK
jgi:hypothetical protein